MTREQVYEAMRGKVIPVVTITTISNIPNLAMHMHNNGIGIIEVTLRSDVAYDAIGSLSHVCPDILVGAGTVTRPKEVSRCVDAGAKFIVSPGFSRAIADECMSREILYIPGVETATDIMNALSAGIDFVKFFPAESSGGVAKLKALASPFRGVRFMPTGGIREDNVGEYLSLNEVHAVGGSFVIPRELL